MPLQKHYKPSEIEPRLMDEWQAQGVYHFEPAKPGPVYSIDTPPPTVSGYLHLGHVYSYSHADFIARFRRMCGDNVYYPMGYDDNGLPTERLVEKRLGITAVQIGRPAFIEKCLQVSEEAEKGYQALWQRLGLSIDWRFTYRTIDEHSRRTSQHSFIELYKAGLVYRRDAPAIWCPECYTAIAQADLNDLERQSEFVTVPFTITTPASRSRKGKVDASIPIATTRPELLPACVAIFIHPEDVRYRHLVGCKARVPLFEQEVTILENRGADPEKGSGAVMCCTFGDTTDVAWYYTHHLPCIEAIDRDGRMTQVAGDFAGLPVAEANHRIKEVLEARNLILARQPTQQSIRVHERCDTAVEYILANQWFIRVLDYKEQLLAAGEQVKWYPAHMKARYRTWVENLNWDWCISRQRYYGVPFPVWYCQECGEMMLPAESELPIDPVAQQPSRPCVCGSTQFTPEQDIFDTWATSSMTPQIVGHYQPDPAPGDLYARVFPFSLRPQAHEIIRTWAFYTILKNHYHFKAIPWKDVLISGWGIAGEGMGKISKSRGGGPMPPMEMIELYSADAVRYWAASAGPGKDAIISEEKIQMGSRMVTKLWNVARFSERFLNCYYPVIGAALEPTLTPADRWILTRTQQLIRRVTSLFQDYDYAAARSDIEIFFWRDMADNYLEMCKLRLYTEDHPQREGARFSLYHTLLTILKLLAPLLPYVTEAIYQGLYAANEGKTSIHIATWPIAEPALEWEEAIILGDTLVEIATVVRRYKSERNLPLGSEISRLQLGAVDTALQAASVDLQGITRARQIEFVEQIDSGLNSLESAGDIQLAVLL